MTTFESVVRKTPGGEALTVPLMSAEMCEIPSGELGQVTSPAGTDCWKML
jgi:hypothetical protein